MYSIPNVAPIRQENDGVWDECNTRYKKDDPQTQAGSQCHGSSLDGNRFKFEQRHRKVRNIRVGIKRPDFNMQFRSGLTCLMDPSFGRKTNVLGYVLSEVRYGNISYVSAADVAKAINTGERYAGNILKELEKDGAILAMQHGYMVNPFCWLAAEESQREAVKEKWRRLRKERYGD